MKRFFFQNLKVEDRRALIPMVGVFLHFILFNVLWCINTTFTPFSYWELYVSTAVATLLLCLPYLFSKKPVVCVGLCVLLDLWFISNLMYYRTYYSAIPLSSYLLAGNLSDFLPSVVASIRWYDVLLPLLTVAFALFTCRRRMRSKVTFPFRRRSFFLLLFCLSMLLGIHFGVNGGFVSVYSKLQTSAHHYACGTPLYTLFSGLYYDYIAASPQLSDEEKIEISSWLDRRPPLKPLENLGRRNSCIVIFVESFESWVLNLTVEGQEITPNLNRLLKDSSTLYAPHVLTQVRGARSMDGQLLVLSGLLPVQTGAFCSQYALNTYYTLPKAMKQLRSSRNYLLTVDKAKTWNQGVVARSFGIDTILSYPNFELTEVFGNRRRLGDKAFFAQSREKIEQGEIWKPGEHAFIQMVTYSGHSPFKIPEKLRTVHFSNQIPQMMNDYLSVVHYTDEAIGRFVEYVQSRLDYAETMIVITGDHEGLADNRKVLCGSEAGKGVVSEKEFTPLIVLNSPVSLKYDGVMGQVDIYPTLLNLLGLEQYVWRGLGQSILDPDKRAVAIGPKNNMEGDLSAVTDSFLQRLRRSSFVSDRLIRFDMLPHIVSDYSIGNTE